MSGSRLVSKYLYEAGCELRKLERTENEIFDQLWEYNLERCDPPHSEADIREIAKACAEFDPRRTTNKFYSVENGSLSKEGRPLCNFDLWIKTQRTYDDGQSNHRVFILEGRFADGQKIPEFAVTDKDFNANDFTKHLGYKGIIYVQYMSHQHLKVALQTLSFDVKEEVVFSHTGFREINGEFKFLHAGGALGVAGNDCSVLVDATSARLQDVVLELPSSSDELIDCCRKVLEFRKLAPLPVMIAAISMIFRAPTASILPLTQFLFITGPSGSFKTVLLGLMMSFFGRKFNHQNIPANFESTANALEGMGFKAKDILLGVDDLAPDGSLGDFQSKNKTAQRLGRTIGNGPGAGRNRMNSDSTLRTTYFYRGGVAATGEDVPKTYSVRARMPILPVVRSDFDENRLSHFQECASDGQFAKTMSSYISWLCPQIITLQSVLPKKLTYFRSQAQGSNTHMRIPESIASLAIGYELFLDFALSVGAITQTERKELWVEAWKALGHMAESQKQFLTSEDVSVNFIEYIKAALLSGKAHLDNYDDSKLPPEQVDFWGWFRAASGELRPKGVRIGWFDPVEKEVLLLPEAAYSVAQELARSQGNSINISKDILWKRIAEKGMVLRSDAEGKNLIKRKPDGENRKRLLIFPDPKLFLDADIRNFQRSTTGQQGIELSGDTDGD